MQIFSHEVDMWVLKLEPLLIVATVTRRSKDRSGAIIAYAQLLALLALKFFDDVDPFFRVNIQFFSKTRKFTTQTVISQGSSHYLNFCLFVFVASMHGSSGPAVKKRKTSSTNTLRTSARIIAPPLPVQFAQETLTAPALRFESEFEYI